MTRFDCISDALSSMADNTVIDGELVAMDEQAEPSFNLLQNFRSAASHIAYYSFDILIHQGKSVTGSPAGETPSDSGDSGETEQSRRPLDRLR